MYGANPYSLYLRKEISEMCKVMLNSIDKVKRFVNVTSKVDGDVFLQSGRYIIDAKSIMGIFSIDLTKPLEMSFENCSDEERDNYLKKIQEFIVEV